MKTLYKVDTKKHDFTVYATSVQEAKEKYLNYLLASYANFCAEEIHIYDSLGYNETGYDKDGYDKDGFNINGYDSYGYDKDGFNSNGYDSNGYDKDGYNEDGCDMYGRTIYDKEEDDD